MKVPPRARAPLLPLPPPRSVRSSAPTSPHAGSRFRGVRRRRRQPASRRAAARPIWKVMVRSRWRSRRRSRQRRVTEAVAPPPRARRRGHWVPKELPAARPRLRKAPATARLPLSKAPRRSRARVAKTVPNVGDTALAPPCTTRTFRPCSRPSRRASPDGAVCAIAGLRRTMRRRHRRRWSRPTQRPHLPERAQ